MEIIDIGNCEGGSSGTNEGKNSHSRTKSSTPCNDEK